jgi:hypothetical protein
MNKQAFQTPTMTPDDPRIEGNVLPALVGLNTRISPQTSNAPLRASMERRIRRLPMSKFRTSWAKRWRTG